RSFWTDEYKVKLVRTIQPSQLPQETTDENAFAATGSTRDQEMRYVIKAIPVWFKIKLGTYGQRRVRQIGPDQAGYVRYLSFSPRDFGQRVPGPSRKVRDPERLDPEVACYVVCLTFQLARSRTDLQPHRELHHGRANNCLVRTERQIGDSSCTERGLQTGKQVAKVVPGRTARLCGRIMA